MTNVPRLLKQFKISDANMSTNKSVADAYDLYTSTRREFCSARKALNESINSLHEILDGPIRAAGHVPEGAEWTFKDDDDDGVFIHVWSEPKQRGRKKAEVPTQQVAFSGKEGKAA